MLVLILLILLILVHCGFRRIPIQGDVRDRCLVIGGRLRLRVEVWVRGFTRVNSLPRSGADDSVRAHIDHSATGRHRVRVSECGFAVRITGYLR